MTATMSVVMWAYRTLRLQLCVCALVVRIIKCNLRGCIVRRVKPVLFRELRSTKTVLFCYDYFSATGFCSQYTFQQVASAETVVCGACLTETSSH